MGSHGRGRAGFQDRGGLRTARWWLAHYRAGGLAGLARWHVPTGTPDASAGRCCSPRILWHDAPIGPVPERPPI
jgi:hypothetical protein